jgi:hypothetical protein
MLVNYQGKVCSRSSTKMHIIHTWFWVWIQPTPDPKYCIFPVFQYFTQGDGFTSGSVWIRTDLDLMDPNLVARSPVSYTYLTR